MQILVNKNLFLYTQCDISHGGIMNCSYYRVFVCMVLKKDNKILFARRANTGWMDGLWSLPGGCLEDNESMAHAIVREAKEELAITIDPHKLKLFHIQHTNKDKLGFYFIVNEWQGEPINNEPGECSEVGWIDIDQLPDDMSPAAKKIMEHYKSGLDYSYFD